MLHRQLNSPTFEPPLKNHRVMTEHTKSKFNKFIGK